MLILTFVLSLCLLIGGAELLVKGASRLAVTLGISPLIIGLTVVSFGTSAPELAVSIKAALSDNASIALGNVIGSNIFNVLFILGVSAIVTPLIVAQQMVRFDVPLMIIVSVCVLLFSLNNQISPVEGLLLVSGLIAYTVFLIYQSRKESEEINEEYAREFGEDKKKVTHTSKNIILIMIGLVLLVLGSRWLVSSAVSIAEYLGVSKAIIALTIIAAGTSMPEVVTSVVASFRGERDIAVGNVVGSNLFNLLGVLGVSSLIAPNGISVPQSMINFDMPIMIAVAIVCLPIFFTENKISRFEGFVFLGYYIAYTVYLIFVATNHDVLMKYQMAMVYFVIPLTLLTLVIVVFREIKNRKKIQL